MELKNRLLVSIEVHRKMDICGVFTLYPHERKFTILRNLFVLRNEGWIKVRKTRIIDGVRTDNPNVFRTNKQLYSQPELW